MAPSCGPVPGRPSSRNVLRASVHRCASPRRAASNILRARLYASASAHGLSASQRTNAARSLGRIIARETIPAMKKELGNFGKNGGDRTRKMKLWKKQARGKARLKERGRVEIPVEIFRELLKR